MMTPGKLERIESALWVMLLAKVVDLTSAENTKVLHLARTWLDAELGLEQKVEDS